MDKIEQLISKFQAFKEELNKSGEDASKVKTLGGTGMKRGIFEMSHAHDVLNCKTHEEAKAKMKEAINGSSANEANKKKAHAMVDGSKNQRHLAQGVTNFMLAHPSENLKVDKGAMGKSEGTGVHTSSNAAEPGRSQMGIMTRLGENEKAKDEARATLKEQKKLPKPKLTKEEGDMDKADIVDIKSKKTLASYPTDKPSPRAAVASESSEEGVSGVIVPVKMHNISNLTRQHAKDFELPKKDKVAKSDEEISFNERGQWSLKGN